MDAHAPAAGYRVVLLSDVRLYREGLVHALASASQLEIVGSAPVDGSSLTLLGSARPDIVLVEAIAARSPAIVQAILAIVPNSKVIAFAVGDEEQDAILCAEAGAAG